MLPKKVDWEIHARETFRESRCDEYAFRMAMGDAFPPVDVFFDGDVYWLSDGFHRFVAASGIAQEIVATVHRGSRRDAMLFACGANANHGIARSRGDKRKAVSRLLEDEQWSLWSDREIARQCRVSHEFVRKQRQQFLTVNVDSEPETLRRYVTRHGTQAVMNTANIGRQSRETPLFGAVQTGSDDALVERVYRLHAENGQLRDALEGLVEALNRSGPKVLSEELRQAVEEAVRVLRRVVQ